MYPSNDVAISNRTEVARFFLGAVDATELEGSTPQILILFRSALDRPQGQRSVLKRYLGLERQH